MAKHIAIIPARAGSKSIPNKNLTMLFPNDKTLIRLAVDVAFQSMIFSQIVITTDYNRHKIGIDGIKNNIYSKIHFIQRPEALCTDDALMIDVVKHALKDIKGTQDGYVWILQPTSPFRTLEDIKNIRKTIETDKFESLISFKPQKEHPNRSYTYKNGGMHRLKYVNFLNKQDLMPVWTRSGNFYVCKRHYIEDYEGPSNEWSWEIQPMAHYIMGGINPDSFTERDRLYSMALGTNIDDKDDLNDAQEVVRKGVFKWQL